MRLPVPLRLFFRASFPCVDNGHVVNAPISRSPLVLLLSAGCGGPFGPFPDSAWLLKSPAMTMVVLVLSTPAACNLDSHRSPSSRKRFPEIVIPHDVVWIETLLGEKYLFRRNLMRCVYVP